MQEKPDFLVNDHFFLEALSCPLKIPFLLSNSSLGSERPVYRQRNKLHLRDAVALRYIHRKYTSVNTAVAAEETYKWLNHDSVAICGAVLQSGNRLTRIPILVKENEKFTIVQVHGKLRKSNEQRALTTPGKKRSTAVNLLKAAYRADVLLELFPGAEFEVHFFFPDKDFRSSVSQLHAMFGESEPSPAIRDQFSKLFLNVDATEGVKDVLNTVPQNVAHSVYTGLSVRRAFEAIVKKAVNPSVRSLEVKRHPGCNSCEYRLSGGQEAGCWALNFEKKNLLNPELHSYDLIGHGNQFLTDRELYYQEDVQISDGLHTPELMKQHGGPKLTMQMRRNLQVLKSKEQKIPLLWLKKGVERIRSLQFPLHFIDFEAATFAIPMQRGTKPYNPLYFQFSCHSLSESGKINHTVWLQWDPDVEHIHEKFVENIVSIPDIFQGTIVHFSPFEKQALNRITAEFNRNSMLYSSQIEGLTRLKKGNGGYSENRFFDLSDLIRDYYYNSELTGSLGIKDVLLSVLKAEKKTDTVSVASDLLSEFGTAKNVSEIDPYRAIQNGSSLIMDGAAAMHAWIAKKNGLLTEKEENTVPKLLEKYCELDSLSMVAVYNHIDHLYRISKNEDVILF